MHSLSTPKAISPIAGKEKGNLKDGRNGMSKTILQRERREYERERERESESEGGREKVKEK